ncbi:MAG: T9SS type A sorting domain-containing protein [Flavobacterium sp.]
MKKIIFLAHFICATYMYGQSPYTIQSKIESCPEIGISFTKATNEELHNSVPKLLPKKVEYVDTIEGKPTKKEYLVNPPEAFGISRKLQYKVDLSKVITENGVKYLRIRIKSVNAKYVEMILKNVNLKKGEEIYFYSPDKKFISKTHSQYNANDKKTMASPIFKGDELILEYNSTNFNEVGSFEISSLSHFYPDKILKGGLSPRGSSCFYDVNCTDFDDYCNQIRSANYLFIQHKNGEFFQCSGALVNNTSNDLTHYVLSAQHCVEDFEMTNVNVLWALGPIGGILDWLFDIEVNVPIPIDADRDIDVNLDNLQVIYNYQNPKCMDDDNNDYGIYDMVSIGADSIEVSGYFMPPFNWSNDIAIIKMNRKPEWQWNVYYAGWTTETNRDEFEFHRVKSISHPGGRDKKFAEGSLLLTPFPAAWYVMWNKGVTIGGSSGSPLFNSDKKIIGPCSGGLSSCSNFSWSRDVPLVNLVTNTAFYSKLGMWGDFNDIVGNDDFSCEGLDPILSCQNHLDLNDVFWAPISWREAKASIKIQAEKTINVATDKEVRFVENAEYKVVAGDEILISDETETYDFNSSGQKIKSNTELEFYTAPCEWTEEQCGFNYFKIASSNTSTNNLVEKEKKVFDLSLHPNPTTQNSTLTLIGYNDRKANILVLDQTGKIIFSKTISKVENDKAEVEIESKNWTNGIYIIRVECNENTKAIKLVKQ